MLPDKSSSNLTEACSFLCKLFEKNDSKSKGGQSLPIKKGFKLLDIIEVQSSNRLLKLGKNLADAYEGLQTNQSNRMNSEMNKKRKMSKPDGTKK